MCILEPKLEFISPSLIQLFEQLVALTKLRILRPLKI